MADLRHLGAGDRRARVAELLDRFDLVEAAKKPVQAYSGGMRRRLDLAMTLVGNRRIIFLDEPTAGLDPRSRRVMWQIIGDLVAGGVTIFLTTQYLEEADRLANRIAVLDGGRIVAEGSPDGLKRLIPGGHVRLEFADAASAVSAHDVLMRHPWACDLMMLPARVRPARLRYMEALLGRLRAAGFSPWMTLRAYHALDSHILGATLWEVGYTSGSQPLADDARDLLATLRLEEHPFLAEHIEQHIDAPSHHEKPAFEFGLDLILDGLERILTDA